MATSSSSEAGTGSTTVLKRRLAAEGEVNSFLARRYQTPIDTVVHADAADFLASIALDLAEYRLLARRPPISEDARRRRDQAVEWLTRVAEGVVDLPSAVAPAAHAGKGIGATTVGEERALSREEMREI